MMQAIQEFELINIAISDVELDPSNPNVMTIEQMHAMRQSMQKYGYLAPIIIDKNNKICDGEHRLLIYKEMGLSTIPAYKLELDSEYDRRQLRQIMNKLHGTHDPQKDSNELLAIMQQSQDKNLKELSSLIAKPQEELMKTILRFHPGLEYLTPENQDNVDQLINDELKRLVPDTALGEIWQLGSHRIICADCSDSHSIDRLLDDHAVDMTFTDPPYGINYDYNQYDDIDGDKYLQFCRSWFPTIRNVAELCMITTGWKYRDFWYSEYKPDDEMIWFDKTKQSGGKSFHLRKTEPIMIWGKVKEKYPWDIIEIQTDRGDGMRDLHTCPKPTDLPNRIITPQTTEGQIVFDPFLGSGSTLIACEQTSRKCYGIEIDPRYVDISVKRWEAYTGKKAQKILS